MPSIAEFQHPLSWGTVDTETQGLLKDLAEAQRGLIKLENAYRKSHSKADQNTLHLQRQDISTVIKKIALLMAPGHNPTSSPFTHRVSIAHLVDVYNQRLSQMDPMFIPYLSAAQKEERIQELRFASYIFGVQAWIHEAEHRRQGMATLLSNINRCADLIVALEAPEGPAKRHAAVTAASDKPVAYLFLKFVAPAIAEAIDSFPDSKTQVMKDWLAKLNDRRLLYTTWGRILFSSVLNLLPPTMGHPRQAGAQISKALPSLGYLSWILYYTRFGINLSLLLKHTIAGPWMSAEERQLPAWERFKAQWQQRKMILLNDLVWATTNLICAVWLVGPGVLGYAGGLLTAGVLLVDVTLATWRLVEESTQHNAMMLKYDKEIAVLRDKITRCENDIKGLGAQTSNISEEDKPTNSQLKTLQQEKVALEHQKKTLEEEKVKAELNWKYKKYNLIYGLSTALAFVVAFSMMCCFFFPPAAMAVGVALILGAVGAALCFGLTVLSAAVTGGLELRKGKALRAVDLSKLKELEEQYQALPANSQEKQFRYLEIQQLKASTQHQQDVIQFQQLKLVRSLVVSVLLPSLAFVAMVFLPMGIGIALLAAGLALAAISYVILNRFAPSTSPAPIKELGGATVAAARLFSHPSGHQQSPADDTTPVPN